MITIDISGPDGNAYALLGYADDFAGQLGMTQYEKEKIEEEMTEGDYENLLEVFNKYFGKYVKLVGKEEE